MFGRYVTSLHTDGPIKMHLINIITNTTDIATVPFRTIGFISHLICNWNVHRYPFLLLERVQFAAIAPDPAASNSARIYDKKALKVKRGYYLLDMEVEVV